MAEDQKQQFLSLEKEDLAHLEKQRKFVYELTKKLDIQATYSQSTKDLTILQKIIDSKVLSPSETWELQSLGVVFGDIFAEEYGLRWVIVVDEYGRDPALRYMDTSNLVFPLTMISKRVEDGKEVALMAIFEAVSDYIKEFD